MKEYLPVNITERAKTAAKAEAEYEAQPEVLVKWEDHRIPRQNKEITESSRVKTRGSGTDSVSLNHESVELRFVEQVVDNEQTNLLAAMLRTLEERYFDGHKPLAECVDSLYRQLQTEGFAAASAGSIPGNLAMVRPQEVWAMVNRYRALKL